MGWKLKNVFKSVANIGRGTLEALVPGSTNWISVQETNKQNAINVEKQNAANRALLDQQTAYNTPAENMKRLEAAGLSPQLAYGQIADSKMASVPQMQAAHAEPASSHGEGIIGKLAAYQQIMNMQEGNKLTRAQRALAEENLKHTQWENGILRERGTTRNDAGILKEILGGVDLLTRVGGYLKDRPAAGIIAGKKDYR